MTQVGTLLAERGGNGFGEAQLFWAQVTPMTSWMMNGSFPTDFQLVSKMVPAQAAPCKLIPTVAIGCHHRTIYIPQFIISIAWILICHLFTATKSKHKDDPSWRSGETASGKHNIFSLWNPSYNWWWCTMGVWTQKYKAHIKVNISYKPHTNLIQTPLKTNAKCMQKTYFIQNSCKVLIKIQKSFKTDPNWI